MVTRSNDRVFSLAALTVLGCGAAEQVRIAARAGYSHIGLRAIPATEDEPHAPLLGPSPARRALLDALASEGMAVLDIEILRLTPACHVDNFEAALALGAAVGARFALVAGNDPDLARAADNLARLCDLAGSYGIVPHVESMPWTAVPTVGAAFALCEACGRADVGVLIDAFHLARSGGSAADIPADARRCGYVQLCDIAGPIPADMSAVIAEARGERLLPGDGDCDLAALIAALPEGTPISVEAPSARALAAGRSRFDHARLALDKARAVLADAAPRDRA